MIRHVVVFNFKSDLEVSDQEWILETIQGLEKVASVQNMEIGRLLNPTQDSYKPRMSADFGWVLTMLFKKRRSTLRLSNRSLSRLRGAGNSKARECHTCHGLRYDRTNIR